MLAIKDKQSNYLTPEELSKCWNIWLKTATPILKASTTHQRIPTTGTTEETF